MQYLIKLSFRYTTVGSANNSNFRKSYAWTHFDMEIKGYEDVTLKKEHV
jgi:hypothetical protein